MGSLTPLLFVYGTLLAGDTGPTGTSQRARLAREARVLGPATTAGRLYNLGRYPGLVLADAGGALVHGELLELSRPHATLRWLDAYEGIVPGDHPHNEYTRSLVEVLPIRGAATKAWGYIYNLTPSPELLIPGGNWLAR